MKKTVLLITALGLLAACDAGDKGKADDLRDDQIRIQNCEITITPGECSNPQGSPQYPKVNFNKNGLILAPHNVCAERNSTIVFRITPNSASQNPAGSVAVIPKDIADTWLVGTNSPKNDEINITVPSYVPVDTYHAYTIVSVKGKKVECLDPRVHVQ